MCHFEYLLDDKGRILIEHIGPWGSGLASPGFENVHGEHPPKIENPDKEFYERAYKIIDNIVLVGLSKTDDITLANYVARAVALGNGCQHIKTKEDYRDRYKEEFKTLVERYNGK